MKKIFLGLIFGILCAGSAHAQQWWQANLPPPPPTPPSSSYGDTRGPSSTQYRRNTDNTTHNEPQRENRPKPPSRAELARAEAERKQRAIQTQQLRVELARLSGSFQIQHLAPTLELKPGGQLLFNAAISPETSFATILVAPISGIATPASEIPTENLRRAAAVLAPILRALKSNSGMSDEDMSFLASQSALAMEGAPLSIAVRDLPVSDEEPTRRLAEESQNIGLAQAASERATAERLRVEEQLVNIQKQLLSGNGDNAALSNQREKLLLAYKSAYTSEADKKARVKNMMGSVRIVWEKGAAPSPGHN
jgi:hypothetical protein